MFLTSKFSPAFRLTTERHLLAETGLFLGRRLSLGMPPGQRTGPDWLAQAFAGWTFSVSPPLGARLVDCPQFVAPEVHTSIEHPYPDRVRRKRERPRSNAPI